MRSLLLSISLILICKFAFSQEIFFKHYTINDGLPSNKIRALCKDSRGYLWIGTNSGISRFDGREFVNYSMMDSLCGQKIWAITEDGEGNMWFGSYGNGLSVFDGEKFRNFYQEDGLPSNEIRCLEYFPEFDMLLIGAEGGAVYYEDGSFKEINVCLEKEFTPRIMDFDRISGKILIALYSANQKYSTLLFDPETGKVAGYDVGPRADKNLSHKGPNVSKLYVTKDGKLYCSIDREGFRAVSDNKRNYYGLGQVFGITGDDKNNIWVSSWVDEVCIPGGGLFKLENDSIYNVSNQLGLDNDVGWSVIYDHEFKAIWYGSYNYGLFFIPESIFSFEENEILCLKDVKINDVFFDSRNNFWIATHDTIYIVTTNGNLIKYARDQLGKPAFQVNNYGFSSIEEDAKGNVFVSGSWVSLFGFDPNLDLIYRGFSTAYFDFDADNALHCGNMWSIMIHILDDFYNNTGKANLRNTQYDRVKGINIIESNGDEVWAGSIYNGLYVYSDSTYYSLNKTYDFLSHNIMAICFDRNGNAMVGSNNGEVYFLDYQNDSLMHYYTLSSKNGLHGNTIRWLEMGSENDLWIGTEKGINVLNSDSIFLNVIPVICFFDHEEGFSDYTGNNAATDRNGNIWVGTDHRLIRIDAKNRYRFFTYNTEVNISEIYFINSKSRSNLNLLLDNFPEDIPYKDSYFEISFNRINFLNPEKDRFRTRLKGLDKNWSEWSTERKVIYTGLEPGNYQLDIECMNISNGKLTKSSAFYFKVMPPWYRNWWFVAGLIIIVILSIHFYIRSRTKRIKKAEERKSEISHKISQLETKALQAQMNPHFTFNAITSLQNYILDNNVDLALKYLSDFSRIIRMTLDNVNREFISIGEEIEYLKYYLSIERMRFDEKFSEVIQLDEKLDGQSVMLPPMILQPFVENAIHHGLMPRGGGIVKIAFRKKDEKSLRCIVEDNGIGRRNNNGNNNFHKSMGSNIARDRIDYFNTNTEENTSYGIRFVDLCDKNDKPKGTRVVIDLPLKYNF